MFPLWDWFDGQPRSSARQQAFAIPCVVFGHLLPVLLQAFAILLLLGGHKGTPDCLLDVLFVTSGYLPLQRLAHKPCEGMSKFA